jgi:shikimate 5-dehydrogenase
MYFIGVTTKQSSIMGIFPKWAAILGIEAVLVGVDAPLHAPALVYQQIVRHIKQDPLAVGALVTSHKIDLLAAARAEFDTLDPYAQLCGEVSCITKHDGRLSGIAVDPLSSQATWEMFVPQGHWGQTDGEVLCLGSGGAATAISVYVAGIQSVANRPRKFITVDIDPIRLDHLKAIHQQLQTDIEFKYILNADPVYNDTLMAALPAGSMVINATGLGKDRPGSPITDAGVFPQNGLVWELNYRGQLDFLQHAKHQAASQNLIIEDGWVYFLHGWTQVIARVFDRELTPAIFQQLADAAADLRPQP